ncbi:hypothetical protein [Burkholderia pseudomallei]|uniref:hypothetical protein n=2 Tax=Burkholderia pseudomallei TaxID=28450 RepID=UPI0015C3BCB7|nr:hypothetical protein [Burkholderia pseudomallei]
MMYLLADTPEHRKLQAQRDNSASERLLSDAIRALQPKSKVVRQARRSSASSIKPMLSVQSWIVPSKDRHNRAPANVAGVCKGQVERT